MATFHEIEDFTSNEEHRNEHSGTGKRFKNLTLNETLSSTLSRIHSTTVVSRGTIVKDSIHKSILRALFVSAGFTLLHAYYTVGDASYTVGVDQNRVQQLHPHHLFFIVLGL